MPDMTLLLAGALEGAFNGVIADEQDHQPIWVDVEISRYVIFCTLH